MRFASSASRWIAALSSWGDPVPARDPRGDAEAARQAMRTLVAHLAPRPLRLVRALARASDAYALWHLRAPLMQALAAAHGEARARALVADVDALLLQAWPAAPVSRSQDLG